MQTSLPFDVVISFCRDKIPNYGEDSYCYSFCNDAGLLGVFDGCGGAGARKHDCYGGKTEAYMASRICAGAFYDCFRERFPGKHIASDLTADVFLPQTLQRLKEYEPSKNESSVQIKGSSVRTLPTTAAVALMQSAQDGAVSVTAIWAGDSRVYILDSTGLAQLTTDDTTVQDPMENIYEDGILNNLFCSDKAVKLHCKTVTMDHPFMVFAATDGCFGYLSTPMEFEGVILGTLLQSKCAADWEQDLSDAIGSIAGDDCTFCLAAYGYGSYRVLQNSFTDRYNYLHKHFLLPVLDLPVEDREKRFALWELYRDEYLRYIKDN